MNSKEQRIQYINSLGDWIKDNAEAIEEYLRIEGAIHLYLNKKCKALQSNQEMLVSEMILHRVDGKNMKGNQVRCCEIQYGSPSVFNEGVGFDFLKSVNSIEKEIRSRKKRKV